MPRALPLLVLLAACGTSQDRFVRDLTEADCTYALACFDDAVLNFKGYTDLESCEALQGPFNAALQADCAVYDKKKAKECLKAVEDRACVATDDPDDLARPTVCDEVFTSCEAADTDPGAGVETDDTDA
jgi:hypothetical protein